MISAQAGGSQNLSERFGSADEGHDARDFALQPFERILVTAGPARKANSNPTKLGGRLCSIYIFLESAKMNR